MLRDQLVRTLALELSPGVLGFLDVDALLSLQLVSSGIRHALRDDIVEARCKRECFTTYLYPTMATYTTMAAVPESWKRLYIRFRGLREMKWTACKAEATSSTLRSLKTDNQEYVADLEGQYLLRSGGHYWFSVLQTPLGEVVISSPYTSSEKAKKLAESDTETALAILRAPLSINTGKWEKIRADGQAPCPRRHHSMTCLPSVSCSLSTISPSAADENVTTSIVPLRRVMFFGGQSEGIPFEAFNDTHVLLIDGRTKTSSSQKTLARWVRPDMTGCPPSRRCGHDATLLSNELALISGGSDGTTPYPHLDVFLLHIEADAAFGRFRWSTPQSNALPPGRAMHSVHRIATDEVLIFGGRQIRVSNGLLDIHHLKLQSVADPASDDNAWRAVWSQPSLSGCVPSARRGHSTIAIGDKLVLIGGQDVDTEQLHCDLRVLDVRRLQWRFAIVQAETPPCPRRGFKTQYFGTSVVISSGFVLNESGKKVDQQLPDGDIHALTFQ